MSDIHVWMIVAMSLLCGFTPAAGSLVIAGTAMSSGSRHSLAIAYRMTFGVAVWAVLAGLGMSAVLIGNQWFFEILKYAGAAYLVWLAYRSAKSALTPKPELEGRNLGGTNT